MYIVWPKVNTIATKYGESWKWCPTYI